MGNEQQRMSQGGGGTVGVYPGQSANAMLQQPPQSQALPPQPYPAGYGAPYPPPQQPYNPYRPTPPQPPVNGNAMRPPPNNPYAQPQPPTYMTTPPPHVIQAQQNALRQYQMAPPSQPQQPQQYYTPNAQQYYQPQPQPAQYAYAGNGGPVGPIAQSQPPQPSPAPMSAADVKPAERYDEAQARLQRAQQYEALVSKSKPAPSSSSSSSWASYAQIEREEAEKLARLKERQAAPPTNFAAPTPADEHFKQSNAQPYPYGYQNGVSQAVAPAAAPAAAPVSVRAPDVDLLSLDLLSSIDDFKSPLEPTSLLVPSPQPRSNSLQSPGAVAEPPHVAAAASDDNKRVSTDSEFEFMKAHVEPEPEPERAAAPLADGAVERDDDDDAVGDDDDADDVKADDSPRVNGDGDDGADRREGEAEAAVAASWEALGQLKPGQNGGGSGIDGETVESGESREGAAAEGANVAAAASESELAIAAARSKHISGGGGGGGGGGASGINATPSASRAVALQTVTIERRPALAPVPPPVVAVSSPPVAAIQSPPPIAVAAPAVAAQNAVNNVVSSPFAERLFAGFCFRTHVGDGAANNFIFYEPSDGPRGCLYWCAQGKRDKVAGQSMFIHQITHSVLGKHNFSPATAPALTAADCFTLYDNQNKTLNFEAENKDARNEFLFCLEKVITHNNNRNNNNNNNRSNSNNSQHELHQLYRSNHCK